MRRSFDLGVAKLSGDSPYADKTRCHAGLDPASRTNKPDSRLRGNDIESRARKISRITSALDLGSIVCGDGFWECVLQP